MVAASAAPRLAHLRPGACWRRTSGSWGGVHLRRLRGPTESKAQNTILSAESFFIPFMGPLPFFNLGKTYTQRKERGLRFFY